MPTVSMVSFAGGILLRRQLEPKPPVKSPGFRKRQTCRKRRRIHRRQIPANRTVHADLQEMVCPAVGPSASYWLDSPGQRDQLSVAQCGRARHPSVQYSLCRLQTECGRQCRSIALSGARAITEAGWPGGAALLGDIRSSDSRIHPLAVRAYQSASTRTHECEYWSLKKGWKRADGAIGATTGASPKRYGSIPIWY